MASGLNPNIGLEELGAGVQPQAPVQTSGDTYAPYVPQGSGSNKTALGAGIDAMQAGLARFAQGGDEEHWVNRPITELLGLTSKGEVEPMSKMFEEIADENWKEDRKSVV